MEWAIRDLTHTTMWATRDGTVEAGNWLLGLATPSTVLITGASPATAKQTANNVHLDNRPANDALKLRDSGSDIALVGDAHYHPGGSPRPSTNDFKGWERGFTTINKGDYQPTYVGLIATGRPASPTFHAWAVRRVDGQLVTKPALVRGL